MTAFVLAAVLYVLGAAALALALFGWGRAWFPVACLAASALLSSASVTWAVLA